VTPHGIRCPPVIVAPLATPDTLLVLVGLDVFTEVVASHEALATYRAGKPLLTGVSADVSL